LQTASKSKSRKQTKKRKRDDSDSEDESSKNFDPNSFHLDLEENSFKGEDSDANLSEFDWGSDKDNNRKDK
jgi:hypothetical protein